MKTQLTGAHVTQKHICTVQTKHLAEFYINEALKGAKNTHIEVLSIALPPLIYFMVTTLLIMKFVSN